MVRSPFILLDDARDNGAAPARLYEQAEEIVVAWRAGDVAAALDRIGGVPGHWAGYVAYEAGLALEPRLAPLAAARGGAAGPLVWFARFAQVTPVPGRDVPALLDRLGSGGGVGDGRLGPMAPTVSAGGYAQAFERVHAAIEAGDVYQVNLTFPLDGRWRGDPLAIYARLRADSRAGYGAVIWDGAHWHLSCSPELFFSLADGAATVRPMKGTAPRGTDAAEDAALRGELAANAKDRAENLMIVDLMRNDLSRVAAVGSVRVEAPFAVETYPTLHQMVTTVRAQLPPDAGATDLVRALFPCGSVTGAPKIRAMELIDRVERDARGIYCGAIGRIDPAGSALFNVAIRTLRLAPDYPGAGGGRATMGVGSAVVADSSPLGEWRECAVKGNFLRQSASQADLIETMVFDPAKGIALIEFHLERLRRSASALGYSLDRHAARNAIQALCFDLVTPAKVRLAASRTGTLALEAMPMPDPRDLPLTCAVLPLPVSPNDWRLRHKTSDRTFYEAAQAAARASGADEALFLRDDGLVTEGSFTNVFVRRADGKLLTPRADLGLLPGVLRASLIDAGKVVEGEITLNDLTEGFLVGNALRGLMPARLRELVA